MAKREVNILRLRLNDTKVLVGFCNLLHPVLARQLPRHKLSSIHIRDIIYDVFVRFMSGSARFSYDNGNQKRDQLVKYASLIARDIIIENKRRISKLAELSATLEMELINYLGENSDGPQEYNLSPLLGKDQTAISPFEITFIAVRSTFFHKKHRKVRYK